MGFVEYSSNNSGGSWWMSDQNWLDLEKAGWIVMWARLKVEYDGDDCKRDKDGIPVTTPRTESNYMVKDQDGNYRYLGALTESAYRVGLSLEDAMDEWQKVTGMDPMASGCSCCGQPHDFTRYDEKGHCVELGPSVDYGDDEW